MQHWIRCWNTVRLFRNVCVALINRTFRCRSGSYICCLPQIANALPLSITTEQLNGILRTRRVSVTKKHCMPGRRLHSRPMFMLNSRGAHLRSRHVHATRKCGVERYLLALSNVDLIAAGACDLPKVLGNLLSWRIADRCACCSVWMRLCDRHPTSQTAKQRAAVHECLSLYSPTADRSRIGSAICHRG